MSSYTHDHTEQDTTSAEHSGCDGRSCSADNVIPGADATDAWSLTLTLSVPVSRASTGEPVSLGVPLPRGRVHSSAELHVEAKKNLTSACAWTPLEYWRDGSLRWALLEIWVNPHNSGMHTLVVTGKSGRAIDKATSACTSDVTDTVDDFQHRKQQRVGDKTELAFDTFGKSPLPTIIDQSGPRLQADLVLRDDSGAALSCDQLQAEPIDGASTGMSGLTTRSTFAVQGKPALLNVRTRSRLFAAGNMVRYEVQLHNPRRASHPGGCWDLGDTASVRLTDASVSLTLPRSIPRGGSSNPSTATPEDQHSDLRLVPGDAWQAVASTGTSLCQASSGGEQWQHVNHCDQLSEVTLPYRGYRLDQPNRATEHGHRASPTLFAVRGQTQLLVHSENFWEAFPRALSTTGTGVNIGLFPEEAGQTLELQPGEKVTWVFWCVLDRPRDALDWLHAPSALQLDRSAYAAAAGFRHPQAFLREDDVPDAACRRFDALLKAMLDGPFSFVAKREAIDEYGWRHFGDLYADHESWLKGADIPSHYNNQYDPIMGTARQYALQADPRWLALARAMARHVMDIDIYDTEEDRAEYNGGLFWHTDHYQSALTATHRTYSQNQAADYNTASTGGGPGTEHCYTTGLAYIYRMTGEPDAKAAVLKLTAWITRFQEGTNTLQECALTLLGTHRRHALDLLRKRRVFRYRLSLDRGVGNYLIALLDSFELTGSSAYLAQAGRVIADTFGPDDDIAARHLEEIESTWFYTIFLQGVVRFIEIKHADDEHDDDFWHARDALLHYGRWMLTSERPYLENSDQLEFVNETWVAQDIRKADILYACYRFDTQERQLLLEQAQFFRNYVFQALGESTGAHYTRIYAILLQTPLGDAPLQPQPPHKLPPRPAGSGKRNHSGVLDWPALLKNIALDVSRAVVNFSPRAEVRWFRTRLR